MWNPEWFKLCRAFQEWQNFGPERPWRGLDPGALYLSGTDHLACFLRLPMPRSDPKTN